MAIIRSERRKNFTHIDNKVFADNVLSFRAMGLLGYLLSKPDNWSVSARHLATVTEETARPVAINAVHETLKELRQAGFIVMKKRHTGEVDYFVFDEPQKPDVEMPNQEKPNQAKPNQPKPDDENPNQEKPNQEKPDVLTITEYKQELNIKQERKESKPRKARGDAHTQMQILQDMGVSEQVAADHLAIRKAKRCPLTVTAAQQMQKEATASQLTLQQALEVAIGYGWATFRADWLADRMGLSKTHTDFVPTTRQVETIPQEQGGVFDGKGNRVEMDLPDDTEINF